VRLGKKGGVAKTYSRAGILKPKGLGNFKDRSEKKKQWKSNESNRKVEKAQRPDSTNGKAIAPQISNWSPSGSRWGSLSNGVPSNCGTRRHRTRSKRLVLTPANANPKRGGPKSEQEASTSRKIPSRVSGDLGNEGWKADGNNGCREKRMQVGGLDNTAR